MGLLDILKQYAEPSSSPVDQAGAHFDEVARQSRPDDLAPSVTAALKSNATPDLGQTVSDLFGRSNPQQQAGVDVLLQELEKASVPPPT